MPRIRRLLVALGLCSTIVPAGAAQTPPPPFIEVIDVREVEILFDLSDLPPWESLGRRGREDFVAVEGGAAHPLQVFESVPADEWFHLLYFDAALAGGETQIVAANALARRAESLAAGGRVDVMVADPRPRLLASTGDAEVVRRTLGEIAAAARANRAASATPGRAESDRILQLDRLVGSVAALAGGGPRALWLPVDGWPVSPETLERWSRAKERGDRTEPVVAALAATGRALAGYGWVTYPVALREARDASSPSDAERRMRVESGGGGDERTVVPMFTVSGARPRPGAEAMAQIDTMTDFALAPFAELARFTSGTLLGHETRLRGELSELLDRRRATYRGPRPKAGTLMPIEIRWSGGDDRALPATRFLRSSTPPEVSAARLRLLLAGDPAPGVAAITLREPTVQTLVPARDLCFGPGEEKAVRVSSARESKNGEVSFHVGEVRILTDEGGGELCTGLSLPFSAGDRRIAWVAEDLDHETWTGGVDGAP